jgi:hypothetical protein
MNNGQPTSCSTWVWVTDTATVGTSPAWIELDWPSSVTIGSFYINTENSAGTSPCTEAPGRNVASGTVQTWNGMAWVTVGSFTGMTADVQYNLPSPATTTKLRVTNLVTSVVPNGNSIIYQWHVYSGKNCTPPP